MRNNMAKNNTYINEMTVNCLQSAISNDEFEINQINLEDISRIKIDKIEIRYSLHNFVMYYNDEVNKDYLETWEKDVGGVVRHDLKKDDISSYYILKTYGSKTLAKRLNEDNSDIVLRFGSSKLLKIGDFEYLPIKTVEPDKSFLSSSYVFNNFISVEEKKDTDKKLKKNGSSYIDEEDYEEETYSREDMDLMSYYTPDNE